MKRKINLRKYVNLIPYLYNLHKLRKNLWKSSSELEKLQEEKLRALLHHAYHTVDYYRRVFDRVGIKPKDIKTAQDLVKVPITTTTRKNLQALPHREVVARGIDLSHCRNLRTSGSTGMPLDIFIGARERFSRQLFYTRMYFENGYRWTDKTLGITSPQNFRSKQLFQYLGIARVKYISIFDDIESQLKAILEFKPDIINSYASALKNLAVEIKKKEIRGINPRIIFSTAELMSRQDRDFITSVFQAELFDFCSCNECSIIAWECKEHFGYHIDSENVIVEFIKEDGTKAKDGEEGEIIITSLNSYTMPFIRYKLGDIGVPFDERCPCGRTLPLIKKIVGRFNDYFILHNGKRISSFSLMRVLRDILGISQYQMIQQKKEEIKINIVKDNSFSSKTIFEIKKNCSHILGNNIIIEINVVEEIPNSRTGKFRAIKSELR